MDFFDKAAKTAKDAARAVSRTAGDLAGREKRRLAIGRAKSGMRELYLELGEQAYRESRGEQADAARRAGIIEKLGALEAEVARLEAEAAREKDTPEAAAVEVCAQCGAPRIGTSAFCGQCGAKF